MADIHEIIPFPNFKNFADKFRQFGVADEIIENLHVVTIPEDKKMLYNEIYGLIRAEPYHGMVFSVPDFILAYLAAENGWGVVSWDHRLLETIQEYLEYDAYWPRDIIQLPAYSIILLDANVLLELTSQHHNHQEEVIAMFSVPGITFVVPESIVDEVEKVHAQLQGSSSKKDINPTGYDVDSEYIEFIDDMEDFQSKNAARKILREMKKRKKEGRTRKGRKALVAKRFGSALGPDYR